MSDVTINSDAVFLCSASKVLDGEPLAVEVPGQPLLAVFRVEQHIFVTDNRCTHGDALLTDGFQEGERVICPLHGGEFNLRTGQPVELPCHIPLRTHKVNVVGDAIWLVASKTRA